MRQLKVIFMAMLAGCVLAGCNKDSDNDEVIWDIAGVGFYVFITDSEGHDLLDSTRAGFQVKDFSIDYQGDSYPLLTWDESYKKWVAQTQTRVYIPVFMGLTLRQLWNSQTNAPGQYLLSFGEFDGKQNVEKREVKLSLMDGLQVTLAYSNTFKWKADGSPDIDRHFFLNGQEVTDEVGKTGVYRFRYEAGKGLEYTPGTVQ